MTLDQWGVVDGRIRRIERDQNKKKSYTHFTQYDGNRVAPSCPPDMQLHVRGGWMMSRYGEHFNTQPITADFGPGGNYEVPAFTNAGYFKGCVILRCYCYNASTLEWGHLLNRYYTSETSSFVCAERLADWELHNSGFSTDGFPLCIVIFQNDGTTGVAGSILPIDAVNRGRSYYWRDVRPFIYAAGQGAGVPVPAAPCT